MRPSSLSGEDQPNDRKVGEHQPVDRKVGQYQPGERMPAPMRLMALLIAALATLLAAGITPVTADTPDAEMPVIAPTPSQGPLSADQIVHLLDGKTYQFKAYDQPLTGTTHWDLKSHTVSGDYDYAGIKSGSYAAQWTVTDNKSCTTDGFQGTVCHTIYAFGNGFMEVNAKGKVHAISLPK